MIVYKAGDKIKVKEDSTSFGVDLKKGMKGVVVYPLADRVEAAFEDLGLVSVDHDLIKKKVTKTERRVKAKNIKLSDEVLIPATGEYNKVANIFRNDYEYDETTITVETVIYDSKDYGYNETALVRR